MPLRTNRKSGIYLIEHIETGRRYVGSSVDMEARWYMHRFYLNRGDHHSSYLQRTWKKYGETAFVFRMIEECDEDHLVEREQHYIDTLKSVFNGIIVVKPRMLDPVIDAKRLETIRAVAAAKVTCKHGHKWTPENTVIIRNGTRLCRACQKVRRERRRAAMRTPEGRQAKRVAYRKKVGHPPIPYKDRHTPEVRAKIAAALRARVTHCPRGHEYSEANTVISNGKRTCRECRRKAKAKRYANQTPEQADRRRELKRLSWHRCKAKLVSL